VASVVLYFLGETTDAVIILIVLSINAIVGFVQEGKAQNALQALKNISKTESVVLRDGVETIVPDMNIVTGDVIILREGDKVPAPTTGWMPVDRVGSSYAIGSWGNQFDPDKKDIKEKTSRKCEFINAYEQGGKYTIDCGPQVRKVAEDALEKIEVGGAEAIAMTNFSIQNKQASDRVWRKGKGVDVESITSIIVQNAEGETLDLMSITMNEYFDIRDHKGDEMKSRWWMPKNASSIKWWSEFDGTIIDL